MKKYAHLLQLALRQVLAAHKLVVDTHGELLYISKECFSNGCAATVDVSYPSIPLFLLYDPELVKGMMRPIFRYAESTLWPYDFAPHDVGTYPILNGQAYSGGTDPEGQMPVEECGNLLVMATAVARAEDNAAFAREHRPLLEKWAQYLLQNGLDPDDQLCTDDFAGHLAHSTICRLKRLWAWRDMRCYAINGGIQIRHRHIEVLLPIWRQFGRNVPPMETAASGWRLISPAATA